MTIGVRQKLITEIIALVLNEHAQTNKKFDWFVNKHRIQDFGEHFSAIDKIFKILNGDINSNNSKQLTKLNCDAYFGGQYNFIFEFDEVQHFSSLRLLALENYPIGLKLNYNIKHWISLCHRHKYKADNYRKTKTTVDFNFLGGRTAQRAYLDSFRDLLPKVQGLNPTLRINEFEVADVSRIDNNGCKIIEQLLKAKLS